MYWFTFNNGEDDQEDYFSDGDKTIKLADNQRMSRCSGYTMGSWENRRALCFFKDAGWLHGKIFEFVSAKDRKAFEHAKLCKEGQRCKCNIEIPRYIYFWYLG